MRKFLLLPVIALLLLLAFNIASAQTKGEAFDQFYEGYSGDLDHFTLAGICTECWDDGWDPLEGNSGIGFSIGVDGNFNWKALSTNLLTYDDALIRQGSTLDTMTTTLAIPGSVTVNYHLYGGWGLHNDSDGDGPGHFDPVDPFVLGVNAWLTSTIACDLPLQPGEYICEKEEDFGLGSLWTPFAYVELTLRITTTITMDQTGVVGVRTAVVEAGLPIADAPVSYIGPGPGMFVDPLFISCSQPEGEMLTYSLKNMHLTASDIAVGQWIGLHLLVKNPVWFDDVWKDLSFFDINLFGTPNFGTVNVTTPDVSFQLGEVAKDITPPTIEDLGFFIGWEGEPVQLHADAYDNCGAPTLRWDFSDGGVAFGPNPEHTFPDNGVYTGLLTATDVTGLTTTTTFQVTVLNRAPEVSAGPAKSYDWGRPVPFHANGYDQGPIDQASLVYSWNFDDPNDPLGAAGQDVVHTYSQPGIRNAVVTVTDKEGATNTSTVEVTVTRRDTTLGYTGATAGRITDTLPLSATLVDEYGEPVVGRAVTFRVDGTAVGSAMTNGAGMAALNWTVPLGTAPGMHVVDAVFAGDTLFKDSTSGTGLVTLLSVDREVTLLTYTGPATGKPAKALPLSATLTDDEGNGVGGKTVEFNLGGQTCTGTTNGSGIASCSIAKLSLKPGTYQAVVSFAGDADFYGSEAVVPFSVGK